MSNSAIAVRRGVDELGRSKEDPWRPSLSIVCNAFQGCPEENRPAADESDPCAYDSAKQSGCSQRKSGGCQYSLDLKCRQKRRPQSAADTEPRSWLWGVQIHGKMARFSCFYTHAFGNIRTNLMSLRRRYVIAGLAWKRSRFAPDWRGFRVPIPTDIGTNLNSTTCVFLADT